MMLSASDEALVGISGVTALMIQEGWRLHDEQGRNTRRVPA
jgi:hypothetical protein